MSLMNTPKPVILFLNFLVHVRQSQGQVKLWADNTLLRLSVKFFELMRAETSLQVVSGKCREDQHS